METLDGLGASPTGSAASYNILETILESSTGHHHSALSIYLSISLFSIHEVHDVQSRVSLCV